MGNLSNKIYELSLSLSILDILTSTTSLLKKHRSYMDTPSEKNNPTIPVSPSTETIGVKTLLGDPKKAIFKLGLPMIIGMLVQTLYNLTDAIWVSGLGPNALSAVGLFFPFFMLAISLSVGLGVGGGSAVSRHIGAKNKRGADDVASHTIICMIILTLIFTLPFVLFCRLLFSALGAGEALDMTQTYAQIMFGGSFFLFFIHISNALLRGEGDAKRPMIIMLAGSVINIILDPIFIYVFGFGIAGAAWASIVSMALVSCILFYWLFLDKNIYLTFTFKGFAFKKDILLDILKVGLPSSFSQMSMSVMMLCINLILTRVAGTDGIAVLMSGWRIVMIAILPIIGIATALVSVCGAAFGAKEYEKLEISFNYALKMGIIIEVVFGTFTYFCAPYITRIFTWSPQSALLFDEIVVFIRTMCFFYPAAALGIFCASLFQGVGKGLNALTITVIRTILLNVPLAWFFGIYLQGGLRGVWIGIVVGTWGAVSIAIVWVKVYIRSIKKLKPV